MRALAGGPRRSQDADHCRNPDTVLLIRMRRLVVPRSRKRLNRAAVRYDIRGWARVRQRSRMLGNHFGDLSYESTRPRHVDRHHRALDGWIFWQPDLSLNAEIHGK